MLGGHPCRGSCRGRAHRGQDQPARARLRGHRHQRALRHADQPARSRPHPGRFLQWVRRGRGQWCRGCRVGHRHGWVDPHPRRLLWRRWAEDDVGARAPAGVLAAVAVARHDRSDGCVCGARHRWHGPARARVRRRLAGRHDAVGDRASTPARRLRSGHRRRHRCRAAGDGDRGRRRRLPGLATAAGCLPGGAPGRGLGVGSPPRRAGRQRRECAHPVPPRRRIGDATGGGGCRPGATGTLPRGAADVVHPGSRRWPCRPPRCWHPRWRMGRRR